jgi:uncharacterized protein (DUF4415 family)
MEKKSDIGLSAGQEEWIDPDDAPVLTDDMMQNAELYQNDVFVRRLRGRPRAGATKEQVNIRLDADILAKLRSNGPGWQTRVNDLLRLSLFGETASKKAGRG